MTERWIPVEERMPEEGKEIQVTVCIPPNDDTPTSYQVEIAARFDGRWSSPIYGTMEMTGERVTAWQPLPAPYNPAPAPDLCAVCGDVAAWIVSGHAERPEPHAGCPHRTILACGAHAEELEALEGTEGPDTLYGMASVHGIIALKSYRRPYAAISTRLMQPTDKAAWLAGEEEYQALAIAHDQVGNWWIRRYNKGGGEDWEGIYLHRNATSRAHADDLRALRDLLTQILEAEEDQINAT